MSRDGNLTRYRGAVEFVVNGVRITADEADAHNDTKEMELRGNVRVKLLGK